MARPWKPNPMLRLYYGAGLKGSTLKQSGSVMGLIGNFAYRKRLREEAAALGAAKLASGQAASLLPTGQLRALSSTGREDVRKALEERNKGKHPDNKTVLGFGKNTLGGLWGGLKGLPGGIYTTGDAAVSDLKKLITKDILGSLDVQAGLNPMTGARKAQQRNKESKGSSQLEKKVVSPVWQSYKQLYGPLIKGDFGKFWDEVYKDPSAPILDIGALFSGGASGAAKAGGLLEKASTAGSRTSRIGKSLSGIKSIEGRRPIEFKHDKASAEPQYLPRYYSRGPIMKGIQKFGMDPLVDSKAGKARIPLTNSSLNSVVSNRVRNKLIDRLAATAHMQKDLNVSRQTRDLTKALNSLTKEEGLALTLMLRGFNDTTKYNAAQQLWLQGQAGLHNEGYNLSDFGGVDPNYTRYITQKNPEVEAFIKEPTDNMLKAAEEWHKQVEVGKGELGIDPEQHQTRTYGALSKATGRSVEDLAQEMKARIESGDLKIAPNYVPDVAASGMEWAIPKKWTMRGRKPVGLDQGVLRYDGESAVRKLGDVGPENVLRSPFESYLKEHDLTTFASGAVRMDPRVMVQHIAQRERNFVDAPFNEDFINRMGLRGPDGELIPAKSQGQVNRMTNSTNKYVLVHPQLAVKWFNEENNLVKQMNDIAQKHGDDIPVFTQEMKNLIEENGQAFVQNNMGAMKTEGYIVPREAYDRLKANVKARDPFENGALRAYNKFLNVWRKYTLSLMPRWLVNTIAGSALLNTVKGVGLRDYIAAGRIARGKHGITKDDLPAGVKLGVMQSELMDNPSIRAGQIGDRTFNAGRIGNRQLKLPAVSNIMYGVVQGAEDYFRTASFISSLNKADRMRMSHVGEILDERGGSWLRKADDDYLKQMMKDPKLVEQALDEVNIFSYNYAQLGPFERRYIRMFVPFWGWYKFITKLAWRLPVEYPGRALALNTIGTIGEEQAKELGNVPPWVKDSIILNVSKDKRNLKYLPTAGLNPFSQFANPASKDGTIAGMMGLGQLSPPIQAFLAGSGIDSFGSETPISPIEGVGQDFFGNNILLNGPDGKPMIMTSAGQRAGGRRALGALMRSFPQLRLAESAAVGGRGVYPESIPLLSQRPMATTKKNRKDVSTEGTLLSLFGGNPRHMDLRHWQSMFDKRVNNARARRRTSLRSLLESLGDGR